MKQDISISKETDIREYRRKLIIRLHSKGMLQADIAEVTNCSQGRVSQVLKAYTLQGMSGIKSRPHPGATSRLTLQHQKQLKRLLNKGALKFGYLTDG